MIYYKNDEIGIRNIYHKDVINLFYWSIDKELNKYDPKPIPTNSKELIEECDNYCTKFDEEVMNKNIEDRKYKYFIITNNKDIPIGFVNFFRIDKLMRQGEMGIMLGDKKYWNKNIAFTAVRVVVNYIFFNMNIDRIYIETGENNTPALKLFNKLNFIKCDEFIQDHDFKFIVMEKLKW